MDFFKELPGIGGYNFNFIQKSKMHHFLSISLATKYIEVFFVSTCFVITGRSFIFTWYKVFKSIKGKFP